MTRSALIVGTGLIGTSIGLALTQAGWTVWLKDTDERALGLAASLGAGERAHPTRDPDVIVVATPPLTVGLVSNEVSRLFLDSIVIDISSTKSYVQQEIERFGLSGRFLGTHPMSGRERSGPDAARADLFDGRSWVLCPTSATPLAVVDLVTELVVGCGGRPLTLSPEDHDNAVGRVSHIPQVVASALAAGLVNASQTELDLAGQGLRDTTRIAGSDPALWLDILKTNPEPVADGLEQVINDLASLQSTLRTLAESTQVDKSINRQSDEASRVDAALLDLLARGRSGYSRIPGKHGARAVEYAAVPVVIPDEPGALADLLAAAGKAGINVEDLAIEHSPGHPVGLVELMIEPRQVPALTQALSAMGWSVH